jgi:hypothetical protein
MDFTPNKMYIDLSTDQVYYIEVISQIFADSSTAVGTIPNAVVMEWRFKTFDVTNPMKYKTDGFTLEIVSSQETLDDYCEYTALSILPDSKMTVHYDPMTFTVTEKVRSELSERVYFDLTTIVDGW